ncbi:hypothetical protein SUDANB5_03286 [Streptomyces sp. SudanB5_2050]
MSAVPFPHFFRFFRFFNFFNFFNSNLWYGSAV